VLIDARSLPADERVEADICIVGAGPAGLTVALELLGSGLRVCLLESGGRDPEPDDHDLLGGESVGYPYFDLHHVAVRAFGGTSRHWREGEGEFWHAVPLDAVDFEQRDGVPFSGWPFARRELVPFYRRAESLCGLEPFDYGDPEPLSARIDGAGDRLVVRRIQVAGPGFELEFDRVAADDDTRLVLHATAAELIPGDDPGQISTVHAFTAPARAFAVEARIVVLAAGGIENPRLLLASTTAQEQGLGNGEDLVGRFFQEHVAVGSGVVDPCDERLLHMPDLTWREGTVYTSANAGRIQERLPIALAEATTRAEGLLNVAFLLDARSRAFVARGTRSLLTLRGAKWLEPRPGERWRHVGAILGDAGSVARAVREKRLGGSAVEEVLLMRMLCEQLPDPASRVTLADSRNGLGLRCPRLDWRVSQQELDSIRRAQDIFDESLARSGLGRVRDRMGESQPLPVVSGHYHHMGTTRMHADPREGVVDADGRVHGTTNLFVTGSSVFPTGGWANPTLTIVALAARLAHHLRGVLGAPRG
jgi:choline dehydrogenase-like flavoprotein